MSRLLSEIAKRKVVYWGVGAIQTDIEALTGINAYYYVDDDHEQKKDRLPDSIHTLSGSSILAKREDGVFVIVCTQAYYQIYTRLSQMGYLELEDYVSWERLLYEFEERQITKKIATRPVAFWGIGKTYNDYREYLYDNISDVSFLIDETSGHKGQEQIHTFEQVKDSLKKSFVIVTSTYYPIIAEKLKAIGMRIFEDFLFVDTYRVLNDYYYSLQSQYGFIDNKKNSQNLLVILAGYKKPLWNNIFDRIAAFVPAEYDVCVVSSGIYSERLDCLCNLNNWSYLFTEENKITQALNIALNLHKKAEYIFKSDEDIFVTKGIFETMSAMYTNFKHLSRYEVGFVSPLIPVNVYGYVRILEILGMEDEWKKQFGEIKHSDGITHHLTVLNSSDAAKFFWNEEKLNNIDSLAEQLAKKPLSFSICPQRYSIGLVLFRREMWINMRFFPVGEGNNLGVDETHICKYCMIAGRAMVIAENALAGHLAYGPQTNEMLKFYESNKDIFARKDSGECHGI